MSKPRICKRQIRVQLLIRELRAATNLSVAALYARYSAGVSGMGDFWKGVFSSVKKLIFSKLKSTKSWSKKNSTYPLKFLKSEKKKLFIDVLRLVLSH